MKIITSFILSLFSILAFASAPLPAKDIFQFSAKAVDPNTFALDWQIKPGYFLYQKRITITSADDANFRLGTLTFPSALEQKDALGNHYLVYRHHLHLNIAILGEQAGEALVTIHYQGCADNGFCYPPQRANLKISIDKHLALSEVSIESTEAVAQPMTHPATESEKLNQLFASHHWILIILSFFGFGLLLAFTPCVLPMVPVLSGIIVGHSQAISTRKAFFLSLSYVLSMSLTYALIGAIVALMGNNVQIAMQSPWSISLFSLVFVLLSLSMFGFYELRLPLGLQARLGNITRSQSGGHYLGAAIMGALSTLILSPCVTAPLIGALGYIAQSGDITLGVIALFFLGLGMGTPLLLIGTSAGRLLPHAGPWMLFVKAFFGVLLLAVAVFLLGRILPALLTMGLWASLFIFSGIFTGALKKASSSQEKFCQGLGIILLLWGLLILIGLSQGHSNPLQPLAAGFSNAPSRLNKQRTELSLTTLGEVQSALAKAKQQNQAVMLDFYADWCTTCKVIASTSLQDPRVLALFNKVKPIKVDITANTAASQALLHYFKVIAPPTFLFFNAQGEELNDLRMVGESSSDDFYQNLKQSLRS